MSALVIKAGLIDTIQDEGRYGYQALGINPGGAMDRHAMHIANALVGNKLDAAIVEMSFPAATIKFTKNACIALAGADFDARINNHPIGLYQPILIAAGSELKFVRRKQGAFCYLSVMGGWKVSGWLGSNSTNLIAQAGGLNGRKLLKGDTITFTEYSFPVSEVKALPWRANANEFYRADKRIRCIKGNEFLWLAASSQRDLTKKTFGVSATSNRMGYRLTGTVLKRKNKTELLSSAVTRGTIQLLPSGELIVLMADHQTTGGYPRVAYIISADHSSIAQCITNDAITFEFVTLSEAEVILLNQKRSIRQLQAACELKLKAYVQY